MANTGAFEAQDFHMISVGRQFLNSINELLNEAGGLRDETCVDSLLRFMQQASAKILIRQLCVEVLAKTATNTTQQHFLERFADIGGWTVLCDWFEEAIEQKFYSFAAEILKLFFELPIVSRSPQKSTIVLIQKLAEPAATIPPSIKNLSSDILKVWKDTYRLKKQLIQKQSNLTSKSPSIVDNVAYTEKTVSVKVGTSVGGDLKQISISTKQPFAKAVSGGSGSSGSGNADGRRVSTDDRDSPELSACGLVFPSATSDYLKSSECPMMFGGVNSNSGNRQTATGGSPESAAGAGDAIDEKKRAKPKTFHGKFRSTGESEVASGQWPNLRPVTPNWWPVVLLLPLFFFFFFFELHRHVYVKKCSWIYAITKRSNKNGFPHKCKFLT